MTGIQAAFACTTLVAELALLGLIAWRGLHRLCYSFAVYVGALATVTLLILAWPERFYRLTFYVCKETFYAALHVAIAVELASLAFQALPGARARARGVLASGITLLLVSLALVPFARMEARELAEVVLPRLANGSALVLAAAWALVLWFNLPLHPFHRAILRGLVPYLMAFTVLVNLLRTLGWHVRPVVSLVDSLAYLSVLLYWCVAAWRTPLLPPADPRVVERLQPWLGRR